MPFGPSQDLRRLVLAVQRQPGRDGADFGRLQGHVDDPIGGLHLEHVARLELVRRDVHRVPVDLEVPVRDELARLLARRAEAEAVDDVVHAQLQVAEQVDAGDARLSRRLVEIVAELLFEQPVDAPRLLLGAQLNAVVGRLALASLAVHAGRERAALDGALRRVAALALEVELGALAAAEAADRAGIVRHYTRLRFGGRHPLCGIGVTSVMALTSRPVACSERIAASRPAPGPRTNTSIERMPCSSAFLAVASAVCCAANGVDLRLPLKPCAPAEPQEMTLPSMSVIEMIVLLNVLWM